MYGALRTAPSFEFGQEQIQGFGLRHRPRKAVQNGALHAVRVLHPLPDHRDRDIIGHQLPALHVTLGEDPQVRLAGKMLPEKVAGGDVRQAQLLTEHFRLGSFARTGRAEQDN